MMRTSQFFARLPHGRICGRLAVFDASSGKDVVQAAVIETFDQGDAAVAYDHH